MKLSNKPTYKNVHNQFKLNGFHLDKDDLCRVAYSFIKEGEPFEKPVGNFILDWFDDATHIKIETSGTTGDPKTITIAKQAMVDSALASGDFFELKPGDKVLHCLPVKFIAGKMMLVRAFILGFDLVFVSPNSHPLLNNDIDFDFAAMVPLQAQNSIAALKYVKKIIIGGASINDELKKQLLKTPTLVFETYGMTETISHIAAKKLSEKAFTVLPNIIITVDNRNCLIISAPRIGTQPIKTNDIVTLVNENQFIFLGRIDTVINSGGIKLFPEQIEKKIASKIDSPFFITSKLDKEFGERVVLVIEGPEKAIDNSIFVDLEKYEVPKEIVFVTQFKLTPTGKIIRKNTFI